MDAIGGRTSSFTSGADLLYGSSDTHLGPSDVLSDMFFNALFSEQDVVSERSVMEGMCETLEDLINDCSLYIRAIHAAVRFGHSLYP